jgi:transposase-like protein
MTSKEKLELLKESIIQLYSKEGRSLVYISKLFSVNRKTLSEKVKEWNLEPAKNKLNYLSPSKVKFLNRHRNELTTLIMNNASLREMSRRLGVNTEFLSILLQRDSKLKELREQLKEEQQEQLKLPKETYEDLEGEVWKEILGYPSYYVSNLGRVRHNNRLLTPSLNVRSHRYYVGIKDKNMQLSRLVGFTFLADSYKDGYTIDHLNNNPRDNRAINLEWVPQSVNNSRAYNRGRCKVRNNKPRKIILDNKYEFKSVEALARFLGKSPTQCRRYLSGECKFDRQLKELD